MNLVDFLTTPSGAVQAVITNPLAAASQLNEVFVAHGFDIKVDLVPVSPSLVGTILSSAGDGPSQGSIRPIQGGSCFSGGGGASTCEIGLLIPADFAGHAEVLVGRPGRPGETYTSSEPSFGPGEALHCSGLLDQPVVEAVPVLAAKGLTAIWRDEPSPAASGESQIVGGNSDSELAPNGGYVVGATPVSSTRVLLTVAPQPETGQQFQAYEATVNGGC